MENLCCHRGTTLVGVERNGAFPTLQSLDRLQGPNRPPHRNGRYSMHRTPLHVHQYFGRHRDVAPPCLVHLRWGEDWRQQGRATHHAARLQGSRQARKRVEVVRSSHLQLTAGAHTPTLKICSPEQPLLQ